MNLWYGNNRLRAALIYLVVEVVLTGLAARMLADAYETARGAIGTPVVGTGSHLGGPLAGWPPVTIWAWVAAMMVCVAGTAYAMKSLQTAVGYLSIVPTLAILGALVYDIYETSQTPGLANCVRCSGLWGAAHADVNWAAILFVVAGVSCLIAGIWFSAEAKFERDFAL